ncbi:phosphatidylcholine:ceramide cholinephosphotransferase 1-like isoform X2 [Sitodiplosis mosellana]|uniref:phosphatidylcholine:ceramide cholinephosphotransferase 1-like isoform X2 n=1 Tax=Sitodiplosis mosellana TaxID=263140 RepID=UPI002444D726|nr:phosphatidylcholine:ceramide cholinephosphotransferase 1-like isoform X2 [Sitodiplosis mosellana]
MKINGLRINVFPAKIRALMRLGCSKNKCSKISDKKEVPDENYDLPYNQNETNGDAVMIKMDVPNREEPSFPKEKWKTLTAFVILAANMTLATVSLSLVHERLPDRKAYKPLPDVFLDNVHEEEWALNVSEILIMIQANCCIALITFHKHRFIVMRRVFLIMSILYFLRSITMYVTVLPVSSTIYYCSPKSNGTSIVIVAKRVFQLMSGLGLSINGKHTYCGDYIYSGHTVMLVLGYLVISEYLPRRISSLQWVSWTMAAVGVFMVLLAHGHYTIDVLIAYYITTRLFWTYHTLTNNAFLIKHAGANNYLAREWWFKWSRYFEQNVRGQVPNEFEWPLSWPRRFQPKFPNRES